jgi:outer membrane protein TolC
MIKPVLFVSVLLGCCAQVLPQSKPQTLAAAASQPPPGQLTLPECYTLARQNYPLIKQRELILRTRDYSIENASKGWLPQLSFSGQATYQTQTISFPFKVPCPNSARISIVYRWS